jgi:hypothetical protein
VPGFQPGEAGSIPAGHSVAFLLGDRLTAGCRASGTAAKRWSPVMQVQILLPEPFRLLRGRLTVGRGALNAAMLVRFQPPQLEKTEVIRLDEEPVSKTGAVTPLWVRVPRLPLENKRSRGPAATTPGLQPGNGGSSPSGTNSEATNTSSQSSPECSPPCHGGDRRFKSDRGRLDSAVRKLAKRRSSNLRACGFDSHPCYLTMRRLGIGKPKWL